MAGARPAHILRASLGSTGADGDWADGDMAGETDGEVPPDVDVARRMAADSGHHLLAAELEELRA